MDVFEDCWALAACTPFTSNVTQYGLWLERMVIRALEHLSTVISENGFCDEDSQTVPGSPNWSETQAGEIVTFPCPNESDGIVLRRCGGDGHSDD